MNQQATPERRRAISDLLTSAQWPFPDFRHRGRPRLPAGPAVSRTPAHEPSLPAFFPAGSHVRARRGWRADRAIGRPEGVVRPSASLNETTPTPRWLQFPTGWPVGPLLTGRDPGTRPTPRLFPDGGGLDHVLAGLSPHRSGVDLADLPSNRPAAPGNVLPHRPVLHCEGLLINCGDAYRPARNIFAGLRTWRKTAFRPSPASSFRKSMAQGWR